ncbi:MAG: L-serine ammonia-lyase, iron-sulfur-dependent, subunit alpha [Clostridiales bacterium]|nr:L-serine ammonia-lyase, iron-sulfur-dependent, subunit alpha [Clostridiales bacterium]MDD6054017.1 L-serine ammonia-lyase, iron-sulfur-dependent, subunit alpha [Clostridiales bacterium]MDD7506765.1 L-serine ammonia-lyase, iron-sulfur-dependent, subunit alpha [Clostridiales bacterium]MDY5677257.1 L-serine ammonia-lyase, iron-sulfur-dependent, subunit alpha [Eubacteriales bacterium]MDY5726214.1 L-serine ammonia-lyase, iron-sulfur-dependent, subunit alpha [Eubacteriales bacterium]
MYKNVSQLIDQAKHMPLHRVILENEMQLSEMTEKEVYDRLEKHYDTMVSAATRAIMQPLEMTGNFIKGQSFKQGKYASSNPLGGEYINNIMTMALSCCEVNASMGRICAAPTAGSCGILPAVLIETARKLDSTRKEVLNALLVASGFGAIFISNATVSGAEGGCQAECGVAAAIAAAAAVYLYGGTPKMCANAVGIALMNCMGLICDPVAGLVQLPCSFRNAGQAANAVCAADLALAGQTTVIPVDEIIEAMYKVGKKLPIELKETSLGGLATTPTAKKLEKKVNKISIFNQG